MPHPFKQWSHQDVIRLIGEYPLAMVVHGPADHQKVVPLPMLANQDDSGRLVGLTGHLALRNPLVGKLREQPRALFVFTGPHGYISPTIVGNPAWGPTWNYAIAWITADVFFRPEENDAALQRLVLKLEGEGPDCWSTAELGERYEELAARIISFQAEVVELDATFKLGQDEGAEEFGDILSGLSDEALRNWMRQFR